MTYYFRRYLLYPVPLLKLFKFCGIKSLQSRLSSFFVHRDSERKSMSVERTFSDMSKPVELYKKLYELCESLSEDLISEHYVVCRIVSRPLPVIRSVWLF